jgi:hypothetical protein
MDMRKGLRLVIQGLVALLALCLVAGGGMFAYPVTYDDRIYPGVSVHDVDVGGLAVDEATAVLIEGLPDPAAQVIELRAGEQAWSFSWADAGQGYDYAGTAAAAYLVARQGPWYDWVPSAWRVRLLGRRIEPFVILADPEQVVTALEGVAPAVFVPPVDAQLQIGPGTVDPLPGQAGVALDVEASTAQVLQALTDSAKGLPPAGGGGGGVVELATVVVPPRLSEPEPAYTLARSLLAQPFTLVADDPLTGYRADFAAPPERAATWLRAVPDYAPDTARLVLEVDEVAVRAWLDEIAPQLGPERILDVAETLACTVAALHSSSREHLRSPARRRLLRHRLQLWLPPVAAGGG